ncbi:MAG: hypothetical protein OXF56_05880 [Rhodobacteraceae bacterium]|nr:hypothetical protein [Paracoccaceae bacterium]
MSTSFAARFDMEEDESFDPQQKIIEHQAKIIAGLKASLDNLTAQVEVKDEEIERLKMTAKVWKILFERPKNNVPSTKSGLLEYAERRLKSG